MSELRRTARERGKGITCVHLIREFCHGAKTPKHSGCQTQFLSPSKSVQYAVQKSSLNSSVLEGASTARLFLIENNQPDVQRILGKLKTCPSCCRAGPAPDGVGTVGRLGRFSPPELLGVSLPSLPAVLGRSRAGCVCSNPFPTPSRVASPLTLIPAGR